MTPSPETLAALSHLLADYFARTDQIVGDDIAAVFAPDGRMRIANLALDGREAISDYCTDRRAQEAAGGRKVRHVMSNLVAQGDGEDRAAVRFLCQVFAGVGEFPLPSAPPATIADFSADCVLMEGAWLIQELRARTVFVGDHAATFVR